MRFCGNRENGFFLVFGPGGRVSISAHARPKHLAEAWGLLLASSRLA
jgi:hypothetical protein